MAMLIDTSILGRLANRADVSHAVAKAAVAELHRRGEILQITAQNLIEFRNFATRPTNANGLGLTVLEAENLAGTFEAAFPLLAETPEIYPAWKAIVNALGVVGKQVHDARLIAVCQVYAVAQLLTFNTAHFFRLTRFGLAVAVVDPVGIETTTTGDSEE